MQRILAAHHQCKRGPGAVLGPGTIPWNRGPRQALQQYRPRLDWACFYQSSATQSTTPVVRPTAFSVRVTRHSEDAPWRQRGNKNTTSLNCGNLIGNFSSLGSINKSLIFEPEQKPEMAQSQRAAAQAGLSCTLCRCTITTDRDPIY